ncbi:MAG TPA: hypothetical protein VGS08_03445 [Candidatus Saccharimonadales bacterium]|nr:hypothetical protein [Candidatus Saccharimonadales bacterium]
MTSLAEMPSEAVARRVVEQAILGGSRVCPNCHRKLHVQHNILVVLIVPEEDTTQSLDVALPLSVNPSTASVSHLVLATASKSWYGAVLY